MAKYVIKIIDDVSTLNSRIDEISGTTNVENVKSAVSDIKKTLKDNADVVALCAPQVGYPLRLFCVKTADGTIKPFLNPIIVSSEGLHLSRETNPSFPNKQFILPRKDKIHVAYQDMMGVANSETYSGVYAETIQQMIEMLDGILLSDYGLDLDDLGGVKAFDKASKADKEKAIQMYLEHLKTTYSGLKEDIEKTPSLKWLNDEIDFLTGVLAGDIKPVDKDGKIASKEKDN